MPLTCSKSLTMSRLACFDKISVGKIEPQTKAPLILPKPWKWVSKKVKQCRVSRGSNGNRHDHNHDDKNEQKLDQQCQQDKKS